MPSAIRYVIVAVVVAVASIGIARADTPSQRFGVVTHWDGTIASKMSELGAGVLRIPCNWADMEPSRGSFTWGCSDNAVYGADGYGIQTLVTVQCTPSWARSGGGCNTMPSSMTDWYDFVAAFVQHYSGYNVVLGIYNEPNLVGISTGNYCTLFSNAAAARNTYNSAFVLGAPETSHHALNDSYFSTVMGCISSYIASQDVVTVHWYPDGPDLPDYMDDVRSHESVTNNVWLSETGLATSNLATQATFYLLRMFNMEANGIARPWWRKIIFYKMYDGTDCCSESILYADFSNKPAFTTYKEWIADEAGTSAGTMGPNTYLFQDQQIDSANGLYHLYYQSDGNLVLYDQFWSPLWDSGTGGSTVGYAVMQGDGNLVVYNGSSVPVYSAGTAGHYGGYAVLHNNGGLVIFDVEGIPLKFL